METKPILQTLQKNKSHFFKKYPLKSMALFGSYARNEAEEKSDVDIMVEFLSPVGFEFVDLAIELENILHQKVDLVSKKGIKPDMLLYIEKDLIYV
ncbi:nucleotidyltransferase family protein [Dyadobacter subterraneus]|uniref:Nucleotidyltransferase family protein n=1 Tax=Dyadobacter subterraneus TaxID=2773304 RepID=A0ABR9WK60_9BACT|nr:nucleotidyltransferase family protein [Dyadobacter subterraneus]MBE9465812.1 nucleotidyltransferase family protein [Dyadobacter subterraneus]